MRYLGTRQWIRSHPEVLLVALATVVRVGYFGLVGVTRGGDAPLYLGIARSVADGHPTTGGYPLHVLYGVVLSPGYLIGVDGWIFTLQLGLSVATVVVLYRLATLLLARPAALAIGAAAAVWPTFIFWMPYIETETLFLFLLSCFLLVCTRQLLTPTTGWKRRVTLAVLAVGVATSRPVGIFIVWGALIVLLATSVHRRRGTATARRAVLAAVAASVLSVVVVLAIPATRDRILRVPNVSYSLWWSTRSFQADVDHVTSETALPPRIRSLPPDAQNRALSDHALRFIREHPADYVSRAGIRFANFWFPWLTADWSPPHLALDVTLSLALILLALGAPFAAWNGPRRPVIVLLVVVTVTQALLVSFAELDSDGRYRVPAELPLLLLAGITLDALLRGHSERRRARPGRPRATMTRHLESA